MKFTTMFPASSSTLPGGQLPPGATVSIVTDLQTDLDSATGRKNMQQLVLLRWIAVLGQIATIGAAHFVFEIPLPVDIMLALVLGLAVFNAVSELRLKARRTVTNTELFVALLVDVGILTALLYFSGGTANPFVFLYLLQITLGAVLLQRRSTWVILGVTLVGFAGLSLTPWPLALPMEHHLGLASPYVQGLLLCFTLNAALIVVFFKRIDRNLRSHDARLATLRQRAAEEEHIVRMGLLASGAAHELGTPLSTLAVILGDWQRMSPFTDDPELQQEIHEMQVQVLRCKSIVSGILMSAGETRGDSPTQTTVLNFLEQLVAEWQSSRPTSRLVYQNQFGEDLRIISDSAIKQMLSNVLDNALEASPAWQHLAARRENDNLVLTVSDAGPGFEPDILAQLGKPYQSSKGRPGGGLGLFLSVNVARTLGGGLTARTLASGGAAVTVTLPLASLSVEDDEAGTGGDRGDAPSAPAGLRYSSGDGS
ncbi:MAG: ATP-binding protein [Pigmentiphaga sp.]